jgi:hypothetical protein
MPCRRGIGRGWRREPGQAARGPGADGESGQDTRPTRGLGASGPLVQSGTSGAAVIRSMPMIVLKAHVENGRVVLDDPMDLPDGTLLKIVPMDDGDDLDDEARAELHAALDEAEEDILAGRVVTEEEVWATLRPMK